MIFPIQVDLAVVGDGDGSEPLVHGVFAHQHGGVLAVGRIVGMYVHIHFIFIRHKRFPLAVNTLITALFLFFIMIP